jgi:hypothetical protein
MGSSSPSTASLSYISFFISSLILPHFTGKGSPSLISIRVQATPVVELSIPKILVLSVFLVVFPINLPAPILELGYVPFLLVCPAINVVIIAGEYGDTTPVGTSSLRIDLVLFGMILGEYSSIGINFAALPTAKPLIMYCWLKDNFARF